MRRFSLLVLALSVSFVGCKPSADEKVEKPKAKPKSSVVTEDAGASAPAADEKKAPAEGATPAAPSEPAAPTTPPAEGTDPRHRPMAVLQFASWQIRSLKYLQ